MLYLYLFNFPSCCEFLRSLDIFAYDYGNFIFITASIGAVAYALTELSAAGMQLLRRIGWKKPRVGHILVSQGLITQNELEAALREQDMRLGEVLVKGRRLTVEQRDRALKTQHGKNRRIGDILKELGYAREADIQWALHRMNRRLGKILRENGLLTDYELVCALSLKKCRIDDQGRIYALK
jgi:hypothetical protein